MKNRASVTLLLILCGAFLFNVFLAARGFDAMGMEQLRPNVEPMISYSDVADGETPTAILLVISSDALFGQLVARNQNNNSDYSLLSNAVLEVKLTFPVPPTLFSFLRFPNRNPESFLLAVSPIWDNWYGMPAGGVLPGAGGSSTDPNTFYHPEPPSPGRTVHRYSGTPVKTVAATEVSYVAGTVTLNPVVVTTFVTLPYVVWSSTHAFWPITTVTASMVQFTQNPFITPQPLETVTNITTNDIGEYLLLMQQTPTSIKIRFLGGLTEGVNFSPCSIQVDWMDNTWTMVDLSTLSLFLEDSEGILIIHNSWILLFIAAFAYLLVENKRRRK